MKVEVELPELPEEYEYTGEYRCPQRGEDYLVYYPPTKTAEVRVASFGFKEQQFLILRKKPTQTDILLERLKQLTADLESGRLEVTAPRKRPCYQQKSDKLSLGDTQFVIDRSEEDAMEDND